jgi:PAS domain S-box-containing protein
MASNSGSRSIEPLAPRSVASLRAWARGASVAVVAAGLLGTADALTANTLFGRVSAHFSAPIHLTASVGFLLGGLALWLRLKENAGSAVRYAGSAVSATVLLLGVAGMVTPARMETSPVTGWMFTATALGLLFLDSADRNGRRPAQPVLLLVAFLALATLVGFLFGAISAPRGPNFLSLTWPVSFLFIVLTLGALSARPDQGGMRIITADAAGGHIARRLLPAAIVLPPLLCVLCYIGYRLKLFEINMALSLLTTLNTGFVAGLIWRTAGVLNAGEAERRNSERQRQALHQELREADAFRQRVMDSAVFAVVALDLDGRFTLVNRRMAEITRYATEEMVGKPFSMLLSEADRAHVEEQLRGAHPLGETVLRTESPLVCRGGAQVTMSFGWSPLVTDGKIIGTVGTGEDVTERRKVEAALQQHQTEIEELNVRLRRSMAETHHRVRNNLQIISALADMQVMSDTDAVPISEVKRIGAQVQALAAVHEILTREAKANVGADALLAEEVLERLASLVRQTAGPREIHVHADGAHITGRQASALAVIANELMVNALKHSAASVEVCFKATDGHAVLTVMDAGRGFPAGFDPSRDSNTGLELVQQVSRWDLQGEIAFGNRPEGGGCVTVRMPLATIFPAA